MKYFLVQVDIDKVQLVKTPLEEVVRYHYPEHAWVEVRDFDYFNQFGDLWLQAQELEYLEYLPELHDYLLARGFTFKFDDGYDHPNGNFVYKSFDTYVVSNENRNDYFEAKDVQTLKDFLENDQI